MNYSVRRMTLKEIARELKVQYVLAGSVRTDRRADGTGVVRVIPELTRVSDEQLVWGGRYDAALAPGQIVHVQGVIAAGVAEALNVRLLFPERPATDAAPTENLQAYDYYLRGNSYAREFLVEAGARRAVEMYERAVELDPQFALAYAKLAQARSMLYYFFDRTSRQLELAGDAADRALALRPDLPEARIARGYLYYWGHLDYDRALQQFRAARERQPNNSQLLWVIASVERRLVVELDGGQHADSSSDVRRDAFLVAECWRVLRFWNNDVLQNSEGVLEAIQHALTPTLSRKRERE